MQQLLTPILRDFLIPMMAPVGSSDFPGLPGLVLWLDAADSATITEAADAVSQWNDKSGLANHVLQGSGVSQPLTNQVTLNGLNGIQFDGVNDRMLRTGMGQQVQEWFYVFEIDPGRSGNDGLLSNNQDRGNVRFDPNCRFANTVNIPGAPGDANDFGRTDGDYIRARVTGTVPADLVVNDNTPDQFHVTRGSTLSGAPYANLSVGGDPIGGGRWLPMRLFELIGTTATTTAQERTAMYDYLSNKWGVT